MRITFSSFVRDMTNDYYFKQRMQMCEIKKIQVLTKNPRLIYRLVTYSSYSYTRNFTNQEITFDI